MKHPLRFLLGLAILSPSFMQPVDAQDANVAYVVSYLEATPPATDKVLALVRELGKASRKDGGNLRFEVLQRIGQPNHFAILEAWKDKDAQAVHAAAAHTKQFREKLEPLLRSPYDERPHTALAVGSMQAASAGKAAVYGVTHVDIVPTSKDIGVALVKQLTEDCRKDEGNARFDALTQNSRPNHMTIVEIWQDYKALEAHGMTARTKEFREKLTPLSGSLYDERQYKIVN
jgi:quinol monooxygenase YgiN